MGGVGVGGGKGKERERVVSPGTVVGMEGDAAEEEERRVAVRRTSTQ